MKLLYTFASVLAFVTISSCNPFETEVAKKCNWDCDWEAEMVCAKSSNDTAEQPKTFVNKCIMELHNCLLNKTMEVVSEGKCDGISRSKRAARRGRRRFRRRNTRRFSRPIRFLRRSSRRSSRRGRRLRKN